MLLLAGVPEEDPAAPEEDPADPEVDPADLEVDLVAGRGMNYKSQREIMKHKQRIAEYRIMNVELRETIN